MSAHDSILIVVAVLLSFALVACGGEALRINATVARSMLEVQAASGPVIRELRVDASVAAGRAVHDSGGAEEQAQAAARDTANDWQCAVDGHRLFSTAVGAYIDTLALWLADDSFELSHVLPFVRRALSAYRALFSCLDSLGSDALPEVPSFLNLIPSSWSVPHG